MYLTSRMKLLKCSKGKWTRCCFYLVHIQVKQIRDRVKQQFTILKAWNVAQHHIMDGDQALRSRMAPLPRLNWPISCKMLRSERPRQGYHRRRTWHRLSDTIHLSFVPSLVTHNMSSSLFIVACLFTIIMLMYWHYYTSFKLII